MAKEQKPMTIKQLKALQLISDGVTYAEVCKQLNVGSGFIRTTLNREDAKKMLQDFADRIMFSNAGRAAKKLSDQIDSDNEWVAQNAAGRILSYVQAAKDRDAQSQIVVNFSVNMPKPGMPEKISDGSDAVIPAEGEVT